jgi:hypothetical protein
MCKETLEFYKESSQWLSLPLYSSFLFYYFH